MSEECIVRVTSDGKQAIFCGEVEILAATEIMSWILEQNAAKKHERLRLTINSRGGSVGCAFAIIDAITSSDIPVDTLGTGLVASAALAIFIAGAKRELHQNANVMAHQPWNSVEGRDVEFEAMNDYRKLLKERMMLHYKRCTGLAEDIIENALFHYKDNYIDGYKALSYGLCDVVRDAGYNIQNKRNKND